MVLSPSFDRTRAALAVLAAAGLGTVVGSFQQGSLGGGVVIGLVVAVGVAIGLLAVDLLTQQID